MRAQLRSTHDCLHNSYRVRLLWRTGAVHLHVEGLPVDFVYRSHDHLDNVQGGPGTKFVGIVPRTSVARPRAFVSERSVDLGRKQCGPARKMDRAFSELDEAMPAGKTSSLMRCNVKNKDRRFEVLCYGDVGRRTSRDRSSDAQQEYVEFVGRCRCRSCGDFEQRAWIPERQGARESSGSP